MGANIPEDVQELVNANQNRLKKALFEHQVSLISISRKITLRLCETLLLIVIVLHVIEKRRAVLLM